MASKNGLNQSMTSPKNTSLEVFRRVERALHELRSGYPVLLTSQNNKAHMALVLSAEYAKEGAGYDLLLQGKAAPCLVLTSVRLQRMGIQPPAKAEAYRLCFSSPMPALDFYNLADPMNRLNALPGSYRCEAASPEDLAALQLVKLAGLLPAVVTCEPQMGDSEAWAKKHHVLMFPAESVAAYQEAMACSFERVSEAKVPLEHAENVRVITFRSPFSPQEHLAIVIGNPTQAKNPLVRVHSSCVTGDILGSLRCDCGSQLQEAIHQIAEEGDGIVLYMSQEGRGIGIANKLRAYALQDAGLDTVDANLELGFESDERDYAAAATILHQLGVSSLRLLTNNPAKSKALAGSNIHVIEQVPLIGTPTPQNQQYLATKAKRCGHLL